MRLLSIIFMIIYLNNAVLAIDEEASQCILSNLICLIFTIRLKVLNQFFQEISRARFLSIISINVKF